MEGSIGKELVIKPLPKHLRKLKPDLSDDEMFLNQDDLNSEVSIDTGLPIRRRPKRNIQNNLVEHVIYKRKLNEEDYLSDYMLMEPDHISKRYRRSTTDHKRSKREAPYVIYPEILVIVDYDGYRLHGGDNLQIKRYFVSFWNGVDLRYKLLKGPKVRISIAGIIISRGRDATPYLERNRVGRDAIDSAAALTDMGKYLFKERRLPVYDIAVAITKYDMCRRRKGGRCTKGTAGFAYVGGACVVNKRLEKVNSVAIIEDTGGFSGIIVAAHEVGHLLGAVHDGSPPPSYLGGPGAEKCRWEDGYIMSDLRHTERGFRWSPCSIQSFHHFLNGDTATCLYNSPHEDESLGRVLPGKLLSLDAQCRRDRGTSACFKDDRVCAQLFCFDSGSGYCVAYRPAAEGSSCGDGQYCINGRCVTEHENIIPDYSQNTPSYIRRQDVNVDDLLGYQNTAATELRPLYYNSTTQRYYSTTTTEAPTTSTTQNYYNYYQQQTESTENPYYNSYYSSTNNDYTTSKYNYYNNYKSTIPTTTTTQKPYYYYSTTTKAPAYNWQYYKTSSSSTKTSRTTTTTTKKPYTYSYTTTTTLPSTINSYTTTKNPYVGDYYERLRSTTKNPYDFANFGRSTTASSTDDVSGGNNNYLKRSSNYYSASQQSNSYSQINNNATTRRSLISGR
ncbi:A disintegrin and metalloproteinase with thrombospondin motifs 16-like [Chrysoperla carnea]|uniref:A disintegrin and metalloproteinase with thrombospondin motifs 16-like n=1 Tax=Chrysoperla carnea TaxID=189513 RepID=UPI001D07B491|nr:A disintegrin and metalloproteinase with thrombospondin motifs 16-like [Chrysoperla carnea]